MKKYVMNGISKEDYESKLKDIERYGKLLIDYNLTESSIRTQYYYYNGLYYGVRKELGRVTRFEESPRRAKEFNAWYRTHGVE